MLLTGCKQVFWSFHEQLKMVLLELSTTMFMTYTCHIVQDSTHLHHQLRLRDFGSLCVQALANSSATCSKPVHFISSYTLHQNRPGSLACQYSIFHVGKYLLRISSWFCSWNKNLTTLGIIRRKLASYCSMAKHLAERNTMSLHRALFHSNF